MMPDSRKSLWTFYAMDSVSTNALDATSQPLTDDVVLSQAFIAVRDRGRAEIASGHFVSLDEVIYRRSRPDADSSASSR